MKSFKLSNCVILPISDVEELESYGLSQITVESFDSPHDNIRYYRCFNPKDTKEKEIEIVTNDNKVKSLTVEIPKIYQFLFIGKNCITPKKIYEEFYLNIREPLKIDLDNFRKISKKERICTPFAKVADRTIYDPDYFDQDDGQLIVTEVKCSYISEEKDTIVSVSNNETLDIEFKSDGDFVSLVDFFKAYNWQRFSNLIES